MKKLFFIFLFANALVAQTPRMCLYEVFNGENNPPSAATNPGLNTLLAASSTTPKMVTINWEVPIPSAPTNTWSLYQTNQTEENYRFRSIANGGYGYTITSAPYGLIDGQLATVFGALSGHSANLTSNVINTAQTYTSAFSITMSRAWNMAATAIDLTVTIQATAGFTANGALVFRTVMTERNINFLTPPGSNGETNFQHVAIRSFPSLPVGTPMAPTWTVGQTQTFTMNCVLPSYVRDKSEVEFIGFIQDDGNRTVAQAMRTGTDPLINDAKAKSCAVEKITCLQAPIIPTVVVQNVGNNTINSFTLTPYLNGSPLSPFIWTGNLIVGATNSISLPALNPSSILLGNNTFSYVINFVSGGDLNFLNNSWSNNFIYSPSFPFFITTPNNVCLGNPYVISVTGQGSFTLTPGGQTGTSFTIFPLFSSTYSVATTGSSGCPNFSMSKFVSVVPVPTVAANGGSVCAGDQFTISPSGALNYSLIPTAQSGTVFLVSPIVSLNFTLIGEDASGCYDTTSVFVSVLQKPVPVLSILGPSIICVGESANISVSGVNSFTWSNGSNNANIVVAPAASTIYSLVAMNVDGCISEKLITLQVDICEGLDKNNQHIDNLIVFPNPSEDKFTVQATRSLPCKIYNENGELILTFELNAGNNYSKSVSKLNKGIYFVVSDLGTEKVVVR